MINLQTGKSVFVPAHGLGTVKGFKTLSNQGSEIKFIEIEIHETSVKVMYPVGSEAYQKLREPIDSQLAKDVLETLRSETTALKASSERWFKQHKKHVEILNSGKTDQIAELIVHLKNERKMRPLSLTERKVLDNAFRMVEMELCHVLGMDALPLTLEAEKLSA